MRLVPEKDFPELQRNPDSGVWYVRKYVNGKARLQSTKERQSKAKARAIALRVLSEWMGGPVKGFSPTFSAVAKEVLRLKQTKSEATQMSARITIEKHLNPFFGGYRFDRSLEGLWDLYVMEKRVERPEIKLFNHWKHFIMIAGYAYRRGYMDRPLRVKNPDRATAAGKVFTERETEKLLAHASDSLRLQIMMALGMGMRKSEILLLSWDRVDLINGVISLRTQDTKTRMAREFSISAPVLELLRTREKASPFVFPSRYDPSQPSRSNKTAWTNCKRLAGVSGRFHDLRHTFLTNVLLKHHANPLHVAVYAGVTLKEIEKTYLHPKTEDTKGIAELNLGKFGKSDSSEE